MDMRELKGLEIAARAKIAFVDGAWLVPSQTNASQKYRVTLNPVGCTCDDFQLRQQPCKHVHAARLVQERDHGGQAPKIDVDAVPKKPTYKQDWRAYTLAQTTEKHRLQSLLYELCQSVEEPPYKCGRPPTPIADILFTCVFKVYSTISARRFTCDLKDAHERGYVSQVIPPTKISSYMDRADLTPILKALVVRASLPLRSIETDFAPDSSGFSTSRFVRWYDEKYGVHRSGKEWVKVHVMTGVRTNVVTAIEILDKNAADSPQFKPLVLTTAKNFTIDEVSADKAYLSHENLELVEAMGGTAYVPFKSNSTDGGGDGVWGRMFHYFNFRREEFLKHYHKRSNVESTFSMVKAKFKDSVRSKSDTAQKNEVLCKFLCHNICCVIQANYELGISTEFWQDEPADDSAPAILPMRRPG
jgi:transposase